MKFQQALTLLLAAAIVLLGIPTHTPSTVCLSAAAEEPTEEVVLEAYLSNDITTAQPSAQIITNIEGCTYEVMGISAWGLNASSIFHVSEDGVVTWVCVLGVDFATVKITSPGGQEFLLPIGGDLVHEWHFTEKTYELHVGEAIQLQYEHTPWTTVHFTSSDPDIVAVEWGESTLTALAPGTAYITGSVRSTPDDVAVVHVKEALTTTAITTTTTETTTTCTAETTVSDPAQLSVDVTSLMLKSGGQFTIRANQSNLTYQSNHTEVAVVSRDGIITAIGVGTSIISVINPAFDVVQIQVTVIPAYPNGDINQDGSFTTADIVLLQRWLLRKDVVLASWYEGDLSGNGKLNGHDLALMKQRIARN